MPASFSFCTARSGQEVSIIHTSQAATKSGASRTVRNRSLIRVPSPGPISTSRKASGLPMRVQVSTAQTPSSSPNIWLISGEVMKSPPSPRDGRVA